MTRERPPLDEMTLRQLRRVASEYGVSRYSRMRKDQLLAAIQAIIQSRGIAAPPPQVEAQEAVEAAKFDVGQLNQGDGDLAMVDAELLDLPTGYGESRIVLMPRDPQWAYTYWDVSNEIKAELRQQGGQQLALRIYDVTDIDLGYQSPHSLQEYPCDELAREWYLPIPVSDRDYVIDIGYRCADGRWLVLARSAPVHVPPIYPADWVQDHFITVGWEEELQDKTVAELTPPRGRRLSANGIHAHIAEITQAAEAQRVAASLQTTTQHVPGSVPGSAQLVESASSYVFPSGVGLWASGAGLTASGAGLTASGAGLTASGVGLTASGIGLTASGIGLTASGYGLTPSGYGLTASGYGLTASGIGLTASGIGIPGYTLSGAGLSGIGSSASAPPIRPRQFWLVADAELIVYGATEPDATVTVAGRPIDLNPDGTFRFQVSFQDGEIDYPILAVAADGEQSRSVHLHFTRETPERRTNTKEEAQLEWLA